ncbi:hypothetical protein [Marinobacter changyiensis]|uniref:hypothetical protein n=1 Tax=Marinobacter changyiensis TaxID=2604091 RepID=UPI0012649550|nr:hypothetical protein [Marinobacter changyiensis]
MSLTWRARLRQEPRLINVAAWPQLDPLLIPQKRRRIYLRNTRVVRAVLSGEHLATVAEAEGISLGRVTQLLNRCLGGSSDTAPALFQGLVPHQVIANNGAEPARGRFAKLLQDVPGLRVGLDEMLLARLKDKPWAEVPSPSAYHNLFKNLLARANWPLDAYPYTTVSLAYESVRRDLQMRWVMFCQARKSRHVAFTHFPMPSNECWLYDRIEIDEQVIDCEQSTAGVEIRFSDQVPPLRLSRLTVLAAIDAETDCVLGFQLALTSKPNQNYLLALLHQCVTHWSPRALHTEGLELPPGSGFPNLDENLPLPLPRTIAMDNAWMHHAHSVESFVTQELGATLNYGRPKSPTVRRAIETAFNRLNQRLSHRLASTSGSSVTDPKRESAKNRKAVPIISLTQFEDALYVTLADANHRPRAHLGSATPLDVVRHQSERAYLVDVGDDQRQLWNPFHGVEEKVVHDLSKSQRKAYIDFGHLRYKGAGLLALPANETKVLVRYDRRDIRQLEAFRTNGQALGPLFCPGNWRAYAHGIATREYLFKHHRKLIRRSPDPLTEFLYQLRNQLAHPSDVANFLETYQEFVGGFGLPTSLWHQPAPEKGVETRVRAAGPSQSERKVSPDNPVVRRPRYWSTDLNPGGYR